MARIPGDFVPLDVRYRRDRAIRSAGIAAELLYIRALAHAKGNETGGVIEDYDLPDLTAGLADPEGAVAALVRAGLWVQITPASWLIRSFDKWNPARDPSAEGRLGNHNRWHRDRGIVAPDCAFCNTIAPESHAISPPNRPDIAPDDDTDSPPISGGESQIRREETREEKKSSAPQADADADDAFDQWWPHYPKKKDKGHARKAYKAALKKADREQLLAAVQRFAKLAESAEPQFVPYPATWLNGERWTDEPDPLPDERSGWDLGEWA